MFIIPIQSEDIPFIKLACHANGIRYEFLIIGEEEDIEAVRIHSDESRKEEILKDIACEKQSCQEEGGLPVYSFITLTNREKLKRFQKWNGTDSWMPLAEDYDIITEKILNA